MLGFATSTAQDNRAFDALANDFPELMKKFGEELKNDHAKAIDMVQEQGVLGERYNVGGHNEKQNIEIINIILDTLQEMLPEGDPRKALVSKDLITYVEDRKGHDRRYAIAPDKIKAARK